MTAWAKRLCAAGVAAYFCWFTHDALRVRFAPDDLMNLDYYWRLGPWRVLLMFLEPWRGGYRPMGGLFYLTLFRGFGLNPAPYHAALLGILALNVWLVYRLGRLLGASEPAGFLSALVVSYHAGISFLYFNTSFVYDALCCSFFLAALVYYGRARAGGVRLGMRQAAVFLGLYLCALNSKEMAVTLPAVVLLYEWFYAKRIDWRPAIASGLLTLPLVYGVIAGPGAMTENPMYRPEFSVTRIAAFQQSAWSDLLQTWHSITPAGVLLIWAAFTALAWIAPWRGLRFCWWFLLITPLPIEFLPGRGSACLAIPVCGLAIFAAVLFVETAAGLARLAPGERPRRAAFAALVTLGVVVWTWQNARLKRDLIEPQMRSLGAETWSVIEQFRNLHPRVKPHDSVVFLDDPFEGFDMAFITELWFGERDLKVRLLRKTPLGPDELAGADHVFTCANGKLSQIR